MFMIPHPQPFSQREKGVEGIMSGLVMKDIGLMKRGSSATNASMLLCSDIRLYYRFSCYLLHTAPGKSSPRVH